MTAFIEYIYPTLKGDGLPEGVSGTHGLECGANGVFSTSAFPNGNFGNERKRPCSTIKDPVIIEDLHASIFRALGISPKLAYTVEERPFYVTRDGLGKPIEALFG